MRRPRSLTVLLLAAALAGAGCVSQAQFLDSRQGIAMQTAVREGQWQLNCPTATGSVISREVIQPAIQGPWVGGIPRAEFTIGVAGCGERAMFVVVCPEGGEGCFAAGPGPFHRP